MKEKKPYMKLKVEMVKNGITIPMIAKRLEITESSVRNKINGLSTFYFDEADTIRKELFPDKTLEQLFRK